MEKKKSIGEHYGALGIPILETISRNKKGLFSKFNTTGKVTLCTLAAATVFASTDINKEVLEYHVDKNRAETVYKASLLGGLVEFDIPFSTRYQEIKENEPTNYTEPEDLYNKYFTSNK